MATKTNQYQPPIVFHPGQALAEKLQELEMGPKEFAIRTNKPEKTVSAILNGQSSITPEMAVQFEAVLQMPAHFWMRLQRDYDEFQARMAYKERIQNSIAWARMFPVKQMVKNRWLPEVESMDSATEALLAFFGVSNQTAWEEYYYNQQLKVAFRISLAHTKEPHAISAWLRRGELQAAELSANDYKERTFKDKLPVIKQLMAQQPADFFQRLQAICAEAGVKLVHTPCISKAPINGCTRWLNDTPLIQLTGRYKRNDSFWFTFFHEAGHILLHGKKDIFLEAVDYSEKDLEKEKQADDFAEKWTLSAEQEEELLRRFQITEDDVVAFAEKFGTHPAIIIGRLQYKGIIPYSKGRQFFKPVELD
jgi:addiction module HigA family antidote